MKYRIFVSGPFLTNTVLLWDEDSREAALVDPAGPVDDVVYNVDRFGLVVKYIINTHEHSDHTAGNARVKLEFSQAELVMHRVAARYIDFWTNSELGMLADAEFSPQPDIVVDDGDVISLGAANLNVLHTPGHSPGSICLVEGSKEIALVGDLIFEGSVGRYDLPMSDKEALDSSIVRLLGELDKNTLIIPGHGKVTVVSRELENNPYIRNLL